ALEIDPHYGRALSGISLTYFNELNCNAWHKWGEKEARAFEYARRAVELDDTDHVTQCILGKVRLYRREFEAAEKHLDRALQLNPNDADFLAHISVAKSHLGDQAAGIELGETAMRLNPRHPDWYLGLIGT